MNVGMRWVAAGLVALAMLAMSPLTSGPTWAQSCTADVQCRNNGGERTYCQGNTVVTARSVCIGTCRTVEDRRETCAGTCLAGRCTAAPSRAPIDDAANTPAKWPRCTAGCTCRNKILVITTGGWSQNSGCEQLIRRCARGCQCGSEPRCR